MAETPVVKVTEQKTYSFSYVLGALIAGLILGTLLSSVWFKTDVQQSAVQTESSNGDERTQDTSDTHASDTTAQSGSTETLSNPGGMLSIDDQSAGLSVSVAQAQVSSDQWVVISEIQSGKPGNILGAARFVGGAVSGEVELLRKTTAGTSYYGLIYKDDGDLTFSLESDTPLLDDSGNPILVSFTAR